MILDFLELGKTNLSEQHLLRLLHVLKLLIGDIEEPLAELLLLDLLKLLLI